VNFNLSLAFKVKALAQQPTAWGQKKQQKNSKMLLAKTKCSQLFLFRGKQMPTPHLIRNCNPSYFGG
jgi:hypothetical protein